ncbi:MAG: autoinducer binding domain-containing protein [Pseudolabrys sp.]
MQRFEDFVEESRRAVSADDLARLYARAIGEEGYENCILTSIRGHKLGHIAWFTFPDGYVDAYVQNRWDLIDPVLSCTLRATRPFFWNDVAERTELTTTQRKFMAACQELKVQSGVMFPFHGPNQRLDVLSISRRVQDRADASQIGLLHAISMQTWHRYQEIAGEQLFVETEVTLTPRELEVLNWCKDGKSRQDIADILTVSKKTVEFHIRSITDKLGASNQLSAVVIALQRGLISL